MTDFYYVTEKNTLTGNVKLLGYNLSFEEKDELFYDYSSDGIHRSCINPNKPNTTKSFGGHETEYKTNRKAFKELVYNLEELSGALKIIEKYGLIAYPKYSKVNSYSDIRD
jgi:hypothetical protein